jgi:hypothetical protein
VAGYLINQKGQLMKGLTAVALFTLFASTTAFAAVPSCEAQDNPSAATKACTDQAAEKKLAGAAKDSFVKKCVKDATAAPAAPKK